MAFTGTVKTVDVCVATRRQSMPTGEVLNHRHMSDIDTCLCGAADAWRHALLNCSMSISVWAFAPGEFAEKIISVST